MSKPLVAIVSCNRSEGCKRLYESIDKRRVDVIVVVCNFDECPYDWVPENTVKIADKRPVVFQKSFINQYAIDHLYEDLFIVEDDVVVDDNDVWDYFIEFSKVSGIRHSNWNTAVKNQHILDYKVNENITGTIHHNAQGCFQHFHKSILHDVRWDTSYVNAFEHGDVEYDLSLKKLIPPFWANVSPKGVEKYLTMNDDGESTITDKEGYEENVKRSLDHWIMKWGKGPSAIAPTTIDKVMRSIKILQKQYGFPDLNANKHSKPNPVSIVVTIKNRCQMKYTSTNDFLPQELAIMQQHDSVISKVWKANEGRDGILLNQIHVNKNPFKLFENFLISINEQAKSFKGDVELIVSDWGSTDDDIDDVVYANWDFDYKIVNLPSDEKFSRGYGLNKAIENAKYEHIHISDVDMVYKTPKFLYDCSKLDGQAVFPIIAKQVSPSGLFLYMEVAGFGIASMERTTFDKSGKFDDIRQWGKEDNNLFERVDKLLGKENVKRWMYPECIHQWHSDKGR